MQSVPPNCYRPSPTGRSWASRVSRKLWWTMLTLMSFKCRTISPSHQGISVFGWPRPLMAYACDHRTRSVSVGIQPQQITRLNTERTNWAVIVRILICAIALIVTNSVTTQMIIAWLSRTEQNHSGTSLHHQKSVQVETCDQDCCDCSSFFSNWKREIRV